MKTSPRSLADQTITVAGDRELRRLSQPRRQDLRVLTRK